MKRQGCWRGYLVLLVCLIDLTGCAGTVTLDLAHQVSGQEPNLLATTAPKRIKLIGFADKRPQKSEPILIGHRTAAGGVSMGDVYSVRPVFEILRNAIAAELTAADHQIVSSDEEVMISGEIFQFWVHTETTALYWDVVGEVAFQLEIRSGQRATPERVGPYNSRKVERTYINPSQEIMDRLMEAALADCLQQMKRDPRFVAALQ